MIKQIGSKLVPEKCDLSRVIMKQY